MKLQVRRSLVLAAAGASVVIGATAVQTAAAWVQASVPTGPATLTGVQLEDQLAAEEARSAALQAQVDALLAQAGQFDSTIAAANARVASDVKQAADLHAQLAVEQKQLAALKAAAAAAAHKQAPTPPPTHTTTGASGSTTGSDDGGD